MRRVRTLALGTGLAFAGLIALAVPAFAHVTISAPGATVGGGDQEITFRVPVEENSNTVQLTVSIPTKTPIASVDVEPVPGWTDSEQTIKLAKPIHTDDGDITEAVSTVTWKATNGGLKPGEFGAFTIIAGQLPDGVKSLTFPALQTYANGDVVKWIQQAAPGAPEPENPAPVLTLTAASSSGDASTAPVASSSGSSSSSNTGPVILSIVALVVAAGALGLAFVSRARGRSS